MLLSLGKFFANKIKWVKGSGKMVSAKLVEECPLNGLNRIFNVI